MVHHESLEKPYCSNIRTYFILKPLSCIQLQLLAGATAEVKPDLQLNQTSPINYNAQQNTSATFVKSLHCKLIPCA